MKGRILTIGLGAAALVQASAEDDDAPVTGAQAEKAKAAALRVTNGGTARTVERDREDGAMWEVEVTKPGGATVDIELDENLKVVAGEQEDGQDAESGDSETD
jgi:uncharacterized membrane protein YkoI